MKIIISLLLSVTCLFAAQKHVGRVGYDAVNIQALTYSAGDTINVHGMSLENYNFGNNPTIKNNCYLRGVSSLSSNLKTLKDTLDNLKDTLYAYCSRGSNAYYIWIGNLTNVTVENMYISFIPDSVVNGFFILQSGGISNGISSGVKFRNCKIGNLPNNKKLSLQFYRSDSTSNPTDSNYIKRCLLVGATLNGGFNNWWNIAPRMVCDSIYGSDFNFQLSSESRISNFQIYAYSESSIYGSKVKLINGYLRGNGTGQEYVSTDYSYNVPYDSCYIHNMIFDSTDHESFCTAMLNNGSIDGLMSTRRSVGAGIYVHQTNHGATVSSMKGMRTKHFTDNSGFGGSSYSAIFADSGAFPGAYDFSFKNILLLQNSASWAQAKSRSSDTISGMRFLTSGSILKSNNTYISDTATIGDSASIYGIGVWNYLSESWNVANPAKSTVNGGDHYGYRGYLLYRQGNVVASGSTIAAKVLLDTLYWFRDPMQKDSAKICLQDSVSGGAWTTTDSTGILPVRAGWNDSLRSTGLSDGKHYIRFKAAPTSSTGLPAYYTAIDSATISTGLTIDTIYVDQTLTAKCHTYNPVARDCSGNKIAYVILQMALDSAPAKSTILLRGGRYVNPDSMPILIKPAKNGSSWANGGFNTMKSMDGEWAIIDGGNHLRNSYCGAIGYPSDQKGGSESIRYWKFERLEITGGASKDGLSAGGFVANSGPFWFTHCYVHDNTAQSSENNPGGLKGCVWDSCIVEYCYFRKNGHTAAHGDIMIYSDYRKNDWSPYGFQYQGRGFHTRKNKFRYNLFSGSFVSIEYKDGQLFSGRCDTCGKGANPASQGNGYIDTANTYGDEISYNIFKGQTGISLYLHQDFGQVHHNVFDSCTKAMSVGVMDEADRYKYVVYNNTFKNTSEWAIQFPQKHYQYDLARYSDPKYFCGWAYNNLFDACGSSWSGRTLSYIIKDGFADAILDSMYKSFKRNYFYRYPDTNTIWFGRNGIAGVFYSPRRFAQQFDANSHNYLNLYNSANRLFKADTGAEKYKVYGVHIINGDTTSANGGLGGVHPYLSNVSIPSYIGATDPSDNNVWVDTALGLPDYFANGGSWGDALSDTIDTLMCGTRDTVIAIPNSGYTTSSWNSLGSYNYLHTSGDTAIIDPVGEVLLTANFANTVDTLTTVTIGDTVKIYSTTTTGYRRDSVTIVTGSGTILNPTQDTVRVVAGSSEMLVKFWFSLQLPNTITATAGTGGTITTTTPLTQGSATVFHFTASASSGYQFVTWTGDVTFLNSSNGTAVCSLTTTSNQTVTANFRVFPPKYALTMVAGTGGTVTPASGQVDSASVFAITASTPRWYSFESWTQGEGSTITNVNLASTTAFLTGDATITANISDVKTADVPTLTSPSDEATGITVPSILSWSSDADSAFIIDISTAANFTPLYSRDTTTNFSISKNLSDTTLYYWEVRGLNNGGLSAYSTAQSFTTGKKSTNQYKGAYRNDTYKNRAFRNRAFR